MSTRFGPALGEVTGCIERGAPCRIASLQVGSRLGDAFPRGRLGSACASEAQGLTLPGRMCACAYTTAPESEAG